MTIESAIANHLDEAGTSLAGRVWQLLRPQAGSTPSVRVQIISEVKPPHLRGPAGMQFARVQTDVFVQSNAATDPYETATDLMEDIENALGPGAPFTVEGSPGADVYVQLAQPDGRRALIEDEDDREVRIQQDFLVWWKHLS